MAPICKSCDKRCVDILQAYVVMTDEMGWFYSRTFVCSEQCVRNFRESVLDFPDEDWSGLAFEKVVQR
jgi:hypothetical protein